MIKISESYKKNIVSMFPSIGEEWLNHIPFIVEKYVRKFNLKNIKVMENLTYNTLLFAESPKYGDIVMKIEIPFKEMTIRESEALILNNGEGACKCLFKDIDDGVVILERLRPGYTLSSVDDINERIRIFKEVSDKFNILLDDSYKGLPTYKEILMRSKTVTNSDPKKFEIIKELLDKAISEYELIEQNNNCRYLLHFEDENGIRISDECTIIANYENTEVKDRFFREKFVFKNIQYDKNKTYYLVITDEDTGIELPRIKFTIDIAIVNNFDF